MAADHGSISALGLARRFRYARYAATGTVGLVEVVCSPSDDGTGVHVTYDLTAATPEGAVALGRFADGYADMMAHWRQSTAAAVVADNSAATDRDSAQASTRQRLAQVCSEVK